MNVSLGAVAGGAIGGGLGYFFGGRNKVSNEDFNKLKKEYDEVNKKLAALANTESTINSLKTELDNEKKKVTDLNSKITQKEQEITNLKSDITEKDKTIDSLKAGDEAKTKLTNQVSALTNEKNNLTNQVTTLNNEKNNLMNRVTTLTNEKNSLTNQVTNLQNEINALKNNDALATIGEIVGDQYAKDLVKNKEKLIKLFKLGECLDDSMQKSQIKRGYYNYNCIAPVDCTGLRKYLKNKSSLQQSIYMGSEPNKKKAEDSGGYLFTIVRDSNGSENYAYDDANPWYRLKSTVFETIDDDDEAGKESRAALHAYCNFINWAVYLGRALEIEKLLPPSA